MVYIIYGNEPYLINKKLDGIIKSNSDSFITRFNGLDKEYSNLNVVEACTSIGLFSNKTLVLVYNPSFLINKIEDSSIDKLIDYCNKPLYDNDLVFYTLDNSFNTRLKTFKDISLNAEVVKCDKLDKKNYYNFAKNIVKEKNINIKKDALDLLINSSNCDITLLNSNLDVISLYPEELNIDVVSKLITYPNEEDVFPLINALTSKNVSLAIKHINSLMSNDESVSRIIASIAAQLRFLYAVSYYYSIGKTTSDIMKITNSKEYRITKANESLRNLKSEDILKLLSKLADLDYKSKINSNVKEKLNLELLIVSLLG